MPKRWSVRDHVVHVAEGDATDVLKWPTVGEVPHRRRYHVTLLSWQDATNTWTRTQIYIQEGRDRQHVVTDANKTADTVYEWHHELVLTAGQRLCVYFEGATASDYLHMYVQGYYVDEIPGPE